MEVFLFFFRSPLLHLKRGTILLRTGDFVIESSEPRKECAQSKYLL